MPADDQRPSGRFELSLAHGELGAALEDMKDLVVRMHVQVGAFTDLIGAVADDDAVDAEMMSLLGPRGGLDLFSHSSGRVITSSILLGLGILSTSVW